MKKSEFDALPIEEQNIKIKGIWEDINYSGNITCPIKNCAEILVITKLESHPPILGYCNKCQKVWGLFEEE